MGRYRESHTPHNKLNQEKFLERCKIRHGDYYDYSEAVYISSKDKVVIICPKHGKFSQTAGDHMAGRNCKICVQERISDSQKIKHKLSKEDFIKQATEIHGHFYDYSKVEIESKNVPIKIICPTHGEFSTYINVHLKGHSCKHCARENRVGKRRCSQEQFLAKSREAHGQKYDYSKSVYTVSTEKVEIICKDHGSFWMTPANHYKGKGCKSCADERLSAERRMPENEVWDKCRDTHGGRYSYLGFVGDYTNNMTKLRIVCEEHGEFHQAISPHIRGSGCPVCAIPLSTGTNKQDYCSRHPESNLYLLEVVNGDEEYLKVGISIDPYGRMNGIKKELVNSEIEVLSAIPLDSEKAWDFESTIHRSKFFIKYKPVEWFAGGTECYPLEEKVKFCKIFNNLEDKFGGYNGEEFRPSAD